MVRKTLISLVIIGLIALFIAFIPQALSTDQGKAIVSKILEKKIGNEVEVSIQDLHLKWFEKQTAKNIILINNGHRIEIDDLVIDEPLYSLPFGPTKYSLSGKIFDQAKSGTFQVNVDGPRTKGSVKSIPVASMEAILGDSLHVLSKSIGKELSLDFNIVNQKLIGTIHSPYLQGKLSGSGSAFQLTSQVYGGLLLDVLGKEFTIEGRVDEAAEILVRSNQLKMDPIKLDINGKPQLIEPFVADLSLSGSFFSHLLDTDKFSTSTIPLRLYVDSLDSFKIRAKNFELKTESLVGNVEIKSFVFNWKNPRDFDGKFDYALIGSSEPDSHVTLNSDAFEITGPRGFFKASGIKLRENSIAAAKGSMEFNDPGIGGKDLPLPKEIKASFHHIELPLSSNLSVINIAGKVSTSPFSIKGMDKPVVSTIDFHVDGPKNFIDFHLKTRDEDSYSLFTKANQVNLKINQWLDKGAVDFEKVTIQGKADLLNLPIAKIEKLLNISDTSPLVGEMITIHASADVDLSQKKSGDIDLSIKGDQFSLLAALSVDEFITLKNPKHPVAIEWTVTPERFQFIRRGSMQPESLTLNHSALMSMTLSDLSIPWVEKSNEGGLKLTPKPYFGLPMAAFTGKFSLYDTSIKDAALKQVTDYTSIDGTVSSHHLKEALSVDLVMNGTIKRHKSVNTHTSLHAKFENALTNTGAINHEGLSLSLESKSENAPLSLFTDVALLDKELRDQLNALVGSYFNSQVNIHFDKGNGPIKAEINGNRGMFILDGRMSKGMLQLVSPFVAEVEVSEELSKSVLKEVVPLLSTAASSEKPIKVLISPEGFEFPLFNWNPSKVLVKRGSIDLGKIEMNYGEGVEQLLKLLNSKQKSPKVSAWFTPLYFSVNSGVLACERMDVLLGEYYPLAMWGKVDFVNDNVKLTLGVSSTALQNSLGVKGIPKEAMLQLPIRGRLADAQIDTKKAATKVASLVAHAKGGAEGVLLGSIVDIVTGNFSDKKPPKPTTTPFPWQQNN